ncbi:hypothetical protein [Paenibacillus sp. PL2-23]|uniref:hypothetical protein n=1 Tax=Paenibacillus sp. PL2-23 TaxID=2100729 RepID=UPI0030F69810
MGKWFKRLFLSFIVLIVVLAVALWGLLAYIAPDEQLDLNYDSVDIRGKALEMAKSLKLELVLTEQDINNLIKKRLERDIADHVVLDGARFELQGDRLIAHLNVTYMELVSAQMKVEYRLEWQEPSLALRPQGLFVKGFELPDHSLETIIVPLDLPTGEIVSVKEVQFEDGQVRVLFRAKLPF